MKYSRDFFFQTVKSSKNLKCLWQNPVDFQSLFNSRNNLDYKTNERRTRVAKINLQVDNENCNKFLLKIELCKVGEGKFNQTPSGFRYIWTISKLPFKYFWLLFETVIRIYLRASYYMFVRQERLFVEVT